MGFHWADWLLFVCLLLSSVVIGILTSRGQSTAQDVLLGNRKMSLIPVTLSIFMSFLSGITVLGSAAEVYQFGTLIWLKTIGASLAYITVVPWIIVPIFYRLHLTSALEVTLLFEDNLYT